MDDSEIAIRARRPAARRRGHHGAGAIESDGSPRAPQLIALTEQVRAAADTAAQLADAARPAGSHSVHLDAAARSLYRALVELAET